jgi:hypothetical protein
LQNATSSRGPIGRGGWLADDVRRRLFLVVRQVVPIDPL